MHSTIILLPLVAALVSAQPVPKDPGPAVGTRLPPFSLADQNGVTRDFASLKGPKGLMLVFVRSADW